MSDIIDRLRHEADFFKRQEKNLGRERLCNDAADEIERLRNEIKRLEKLVSGIGGR